MPQLTGKDRRYLRSLGNPLKPVVWIGKEGLTPAVRRSIDEAHRGSELIKVKLLDPADHDRKAIAAGIEQGSKSLVVGVVGGTFLLFRRDEKTPVIELPSVG
jgi:RNA-binding protein